MILHVALFRWQPGVTDDDVARLVAALEEMARGIPEIRGYRCGANLRLRPSPADFAVVALVDDEAGLSAYLDAPSHARVYSDHLTAMVADRQASQLTVPDGVAL
ncbi:Dabb family protein [Microbacterium insulae]|uniref:Dabb family protein n=1 Tax=Microbacterium insulae TaxID=483014 RepID=A0ABW3AKN8_9MICO